MLGWPHFEVISATSLQQTLKVGRRGLVKVMFSGIIETTSRMVAATPGSKSFLVSVKKPNNFSDLSVGDSVAINGVCLTVERFDAEVVDFTIAAETLRITGWTQEFLEKSAFNLERSMRASDRVHGHFVLGHVDGLTELVEKRNVGDSLVLKFRLPENYKAYVWKKGSLTLNGVSLTLNEVLGADVEVCLIPETLKRTNLADLNVGESITFEVDSMARAFVHLWQMERKDA